MQRVVLGRTGLSVSNLGLGAGGDSRLGQQQDEAAAVRLVRAALSDGINFIDTAEAYGTEGVIGQALSEVPRDQVVISTKKKTFGDEQVEPEHVVRSLEDSLRRLRTDYVDIYHLHGVRPEHYADLRDRLLPSLIKLQEQGKVRFLGITEAFAADPEHLMLQQALADDLWDVVMVGFNLLNQTARERVFPLTIKKEVGTLIMFAVRRALSRPERLHELLEDLARRGKIEPATAQAGLGFLIHDSGAVSLTDAAYRFCRVEPGAHVVLSGTGNLSHLRENVRSFHQPPLPERDRARLIEQFRRVADVSGH
ncbi:MAG: putative aldo/keto reductase family protein [Myxococcaceae bacterium]|nr:putative aldo/keto reductase family protein [Myxococcaceae bacterium]